MSGAHAAPRRPLTFDVHEGTVVTLRLGTLGREPALAIIGVLGPLAAVLVSVAPGLSSGWQTSIESLAYAAAGVCTAMVVRSDKLAPAILGLGQALLNVALAAGAPLDDQQQTAIMTAVALLVAAFVRTQVTAPLPPTIPPPFTPAAPASAVTPTAAPTPTPTLTPNPEPPSTIAGMPYQP